MSYHVLARKWRPRDFASLVGQEHVVKALTHALDQQRLHHAWLFTGTRGVGKTTLARILAKSLNCETGVSSRPCGKCQACVEIDAGRFIDLLEVDAATNTRVEEMRQLLDNAIYAPTRGRFKVYVIDEVHMLSTSAFNAMLKTLEEPPEHIKFILATTDPQKIPVTVLSRCLQFNLKQMPASAVFVHLGRVLAAEGVESEPQALRLIAAAARGSMRDALSLLDQAIAYGAGKLDHAGVAAMLGTVDDGQLFEILEAVAEGDAQRMLAAADAMEAASVSFDTALADLAALLHGIALAQRAPAAIGEEEPRREDILSLARRLDPEDVQLWYQIAIQGRQDLPHAPDPYAGFTMALLRMLAFRIEEAAGSAAPGVARTGAGMRAERPGAAAATAVPPAARASARAAPAGELGDWPSLARSLRLSGVARQLAQQSELAGVEGDVVKLRLPETFRHLAERSFQERLCQALEEHLGRKLRLEVAVGGDTRDSAQDRAESAIDVDPFVRQMVEQFDATIIESSIKPAG